MNATHIFRLTLALLATSLSAALGASCGSEPGDSGGEGGAGAQTSSQSAQSSSSGSNVGGAGSGGDSSAGGSGSGSGGSGTGGAMNACGDMVCSPDLAESCETCPMDCGDCPMCAGAGPATTALDAEEQAFLGIINQYRAQNGKGPLDGCVSLHRAAQGHSEDMRDQNYVDHIGLDGSTPPDRACAACYELGCDPIFGVGENLAAGNAGAQATFNQWKASPGHNMNMLNGSFTVIGIGRATGGGQYGVYWTTLFGADVEPSCF